MSDGEVRSTRPRRIGFDVLRAGAAIGVAVTHVAFVTGVVNPERWGSPLRRFLPRFDVGVSVFFVLSGLLVARPFVAALLDDRPGPAGGEFALRRLARILPLYWVVLAVTLAVGHRTPGPAELVADTFLLHIYRPAWAIGPITQSWTLATELSFYAAVPLWAAWQRRRLARRGIGERDARARSLASSLLWWVVGSLAFRLAVVAATDRYVVGSGATDRRGALLTWLPNHLDHFAVGVLLAIWTACGWRRPTRAVRAVGVVVAGVAFAWVSLALDLPPYFTGFDGPQTVGRHLGNLVVAVGLVGAVALAPDRPDAARGRLLGRVAAAAGLGTYGIYLWHQGVAERWLEHTGDAPFTAAFPTALAVVLILSAALAAVGYRLVERPAQRAARRQERPVGDPRVLSGLPALDGLRGLAILAVLGTHVVFLDNGRTTWALRGGFLGVDVFLSLSGFLIAATLLREVDRTGDLDLRAYARRRARRLVPPLAVFVVIHLVVAVALGDALREQLLQAVLSLTFVSNWQLTRGHQPPYDLVHLWSLAVEGQLYLLCGLALWWARRHLNRVRLLLWCLGGAILVVATWRLVATRAGGDLEALYQRTDLRADALFVGIAAALAWRARLMGERTAAVVGALALAATAVAMVVAAPDDRWLFLGGFTGIALASAATVVAAAQGAGPVAWLARLAPLRWFGRISYSLYLWHLPVYLWTVRALGQDAPLAVKAGVAVPAAVLIGWLGYRLVESAIAQRQPRPVERFEEVGPVADR